MTAKTSGWKPDDTAGWEACRYKKDQAMKKNQDQPAAALRCVAELHSAGGKGRFLWQNC